MSTEDELAKEAFVVRVEPDRATTWKVVTVAVLGVLVLLGCILWVWLWMPSPGPTVPALAREAPRQIAGVNQTLVESDRGAEADRAAARDRLRRYGWVDRDGGVVHIPIDRAMDLVLEERRGGQEP